MDFGLSEEQKLLKEAAHDFLSRECPRTVVKRFEGGAEPYPIELWQKMAELGWMGLVVPEAYGGSGGSFFDLTILSEAMGYHLCPGPFYATVVLGGLTVLAAGSEAQKRALLPGIVNGRRIVTMALTETDACGDAGSIRCRADAAGDGAVLDGLKLFVPYANEADTFLCVARTARNGSPENGISLFIVPRETDGITKTPLNTLVRDRQCEVVFRNVRLPGNGLLGDLNAGWPIVVNTLIKASVILSAEMIGGALAVMDMSLQYAKERTQFNRPIGSFQAIQHHLANMWIEIHGSRYLVQKAAWRISEGDDAAMEAAMAKARTGKAYRQVTLLGHQIFGGIGFTKEHDMYLYHKRSITGDLDLGQADVHLDRVATGLGL